MNINQINTVYSWLANLANIPNWLALPVIPQDIQNIKNGLIRISQDIERDYPYFSKELFIQKDNLFIGYGTINPVIFGEIFEILKTLRQGNSSVNMVMWDYIHPRIVTVSKKLFEDEHYANAAEDAFIEINDRVKKLFSILKPDAAKVPDGQNAMNTVFSDNTPLVEFCNRANVTGSNTQKGFMQMLSGAMSALRNPKAHANIILTKDDAVRQLMFASMLMYKIDEAVKYSQIVEK